MTETTPTEPAEPATPTERVQATGPAASPVTRRRRRRGALRPIAVRLRLTSRRTRRSIAAARAALAAAGRRLTRRALPLAILAVLGFGAGATLAVVYGQFGAHPGRDAAAWAGRSLEFTGSASCAVCHATQAAALASSRHGDVRCESCHGPLDGHPAVDPTPALLAPAVAAGADAGPASPKPLVAGALLTDAVAGLDPSASTRLCVTCHQQVVGRPLGFPAVDPATHHLGPACVLCHDPHAAIAPQPPIVRHPLTGLPECTVCHSPTGMRPLPQGHPTWSGSCLACHERLSS